MRFDVFMLDGYFVGSFNGHQAQSEASFRTWCWQTNRNPENYYYHAHIEI